MGRLGEVRVRIGSGYQRGCRASVSRCRTGSE